MSHPKDFSFPGYFHFVTALEVKDQGSFFELVRRGYFGSSPVDMDFGKFFQTLDQNKDPLSPERFMYALEVRMKLVK